MDLSLAMGIPVEVLTRVMSERELRRWSLYQRRKLLPMQRLELYLAQVAQLVAMTGGAKDAKIKDFIIELKEASDAETPDEDVDLVALREAFGYQPRRKVANG